MSVYSHMAYGVLLYSALPIDAQRELVSRIPSLISREIPIIFNRHNLLLSARAAEDGDRNYKPIKQICLLTTMCEPDRLTVALRAS